MVQIIQTTQLSFKILFSEEVITLVVIPSKTRNIVLQHTTQIQTLNILLFIINMFKYVNYFKLKFLKRKILKY